jgi:L-threonylcarbamoyladenylate synthase
MLDSHYAPRARVVLCADAEEMVARYRALAAQGARAGALIVAGQRAACENIHPHYVLGASLEEVARNLYAGLRALDDAGVDVILAPSIAPAGLGEAIADRLTRAAAERSPTP